METRIADGAVNHFRPGRAALSPQTALLAGSFLLWQVAKVGLIVDGKCGAGQIRAAKIQQVIGYTEGV